MTSKKMCYALQNSAIRHENMFGHLSVFLCRRHQPGSRPRATRREQQQKIIILFCRGSSAMILLWMSPHTSATFLPLMHGSTYTPQSGRNFFPSSCGLICLSQMSFQVVKVSTKVDKKGHPGVFRSRVRHLSSLGTNRAKLWPIQGNFPFPCEGIAMGFLLSWRKKADLGSVVTRAYRALYRRKCRCFRELHHVLLSHQGCVVKRYTVVRINILIIISPKWNSYSESRKILMGVWKIEVAVLRWYSFMASVWLACRTGGTSWVKTFLGDILVQSAKVYMNFCEVETTNRVAACCSRESPAQTAEAPGQFPCTQRVQGFAGLHHFLSIPGWSDTT